MSLRYWEAFFSKKSIFENFPFILETNFKLFYFKFDEKYFLITNYFLNNKTILLTKFNCGNLKF